MSVLMMERRSRNGFRHDPVIDGERRYFLCRQCRLWPGAVLRQLCGPL